MESQLAATVEGHSQGPHDSLGARLLRSLASGVPLWAPGWQPVPGTERELEWLMQGGLGPLLWCTWPRGLSVPPAWADRLRSAELSACIRQGARIETTVELLADCQALQVSATLLKGISVSEQYYAADHLRPMGDIDLLIPAADYARVEARLLQRGFERLPFPAHPRFHHGAPLFDARRDVLVELHRQLFPADLPLRRGATFHLATLERHSVDSTYHGQPARRLVPELQLAFMAASWMADITRHRLQPSFLPSMFDAAALLRAEAGRVDWDLLLALADNGLVRASLQVLLGHLDGMGAAPVPARVLQALAQGNGWLGPLQARWIHHVVDTHLLAGRPWRSPWPPPVPGRYSPARQLRKRVLRQPQGVEP